MKELKENITVRDLDGLFIEKEELELKLSFKRTNEYQPLELASFIHFILSAIKHRPKMELITNIDSSDIQKIENEFYDHYDLMCLLLYKTDIILKDKNGKLINNESFINPFIRKLKSQNELFSNDLKSQHLKKFQKRNLSPKDSRKNKFGATFLIPCFDHQKANDLDKNYYLYNALKTKGPKDIELWVERLFRFSDLKIDLQNQLFDFAVVIHELMQNTHDWARTTFDDNFYVSPNIRACIIKISLEDGIVSHESSDHVGSYIKEVVSGSKDDFNISNKQSKLPFYGEKVGLCEISVFDTGPGMARRWLKKDYPNFTEKEELDAVYKCFHKYFTSDISSNSHLRGRGLNNIINIIGKTGLLRVRSGGVLMLRNFHKNNLDEKEVSTSQLFFDVKDHGLPKIEGCSISVICPFIYSK